MVTIYNTTLSATSQRHFSDGLGGYYIFCNDYSGNHYSDCRNNCKKPAPEEAGSCGRWDSNPHAGRHKILSLA